MKKTTPVRCPWERCGDYEKRGEVACKKCQYNSPMIDVALGTEHLDNKGTSEESLLGFDLFEEKDE